MESAAQECAATTMHHRRSRPHLLLILAGPPLPYMQRLKTDLKLKWSICNTSFLPIHPQGTETFHKNHIKHPTYSLTSPYWFLIPHCTHALKRKFLPAPFSFYVLFLPGKQVSLQSHFLLLPTGACSVLITFQPQHKANPLCWSTLLPWWLWRIWFLSFKADLGKGHSAAAKWSANTYPVQGKPVCSIKAPAFTVSKTHGLGTEGCWAFSDLTDLIRLGRSQPKQRRLEPTALGMKNIFGLFSFLWIFKISEILFVFFLIF